MYDENLFYYWTFGEWLNRIRGANLARIDAHELAIQAAWVSGIVSRPTKGRPKGPTHYFDAQKARREILQGVQSTKKQADFTYYNRMKEGLAHFDWYSAFVAKEKDE